MSVAKAALASRAANQQKAIESRFSEFLHHGLFLNIGSGQAPMLGESWENVDGNPKAPADHHFDLLQPWPLADSAYDVVMAIHVLEHFTGDELFRLIWEAGRVLKPDGCLAAVVPHGLHSYHYSNPFHKQAWTEATPFQFNRLVYEQENSQSTGADQGKPMHAWRVSNLTFVPDPAWANESSETLMVAKSRYLNVISEMSFAMVLEGK